MPPTVRISKHLFNFLSQLVLKVKENNRSKYLVKNSNFFRETIYFFFTKLRMTYEWLMKHFLKKKQTTIKFVIIN